MNIVIPTNKEAVTPFDQKHSKTEDSRTIENTGDNFKIYSQGMIDSFYK